MDVVIASRGLTKDYGSVLALDDSVFQPVGAAGRVRRDDDLVGREHPQRILDRLARIVVPDDPSRVDPVTRESGQGLVETHLRDAPRGVLVGGPVADARVQRRRDDEDLGVARDLL